MVTPTGGGRETPKHVASAQTAKKGDVARDLIEALDLATTIIVPRSLKKANKHNEISRLLTEYKKDRLKDALKDRVVVLPIAGDVDLVACSIFRKQTQAGGWTAAKKGHPHPRTGG